MPDLSEVFDDAPVMDTAPTPAPAPEPVKAETKPANDGGEYDYTELEQLESRMEADKQEKFNDAPKKDEVHAVPADVDDKKADSDQADTTAPPQIDADLLAQAQAWGISYEAATKLGEAALSKELNRMWARRAVAEAQKDVPAQPSESDVLKAEIDAMKADTDGYDERIVKVMETTYERLRRMEQREAMLEQRHSHSELAQSHQAETEKWDTLLNGIDMPDVFGKGAFGREIKENSKEFANRSKVVQAAIGLRAAFPTEDDSALLVRAARAAFGDKFETKAQQELSKQLAKREGQILPRPRSTPSASPKSDFERFKEKYDKIIGPSAKTQTVDEIFA